MDVSSIAIVLLHRSTSRLDELAERFASDYPDLRVVARISSLDEVSPSSLAQTIVLTDSVAEAGATVVDRVRAIRSLGARVIVLGDKDFPTGVVPAMAAGADAVLPPRSSSRRVAEQVRLVANRARLIAP